MMSYSYSPSTKGFYTSEIQYPTLPDDIIELSDEEYRNIYDTLSKGRKEIKVKDNKLTLVDSVIVLTWDNIRSKRNRLLKESDYTQMPDYPGDKNAWAAYRQALRDITLFNDPNEVRWPTKPKG